MLLAIPKTETCLQRIDHNLSTYHLDSCFYYSYLLAHKYRFSADYSNSARIWYNIAFLELEKDQFSRAQAAKQIAEKYVENIKSHTFSRDLIFYRNTYLALYYYKKKNDAAASFFLTKVALPNNLLPKQMQYLLRLYQGSTLFNINLGDLGIKTVKSVIAELKVNQDTACFAFGCGYYCLGQFDYIGSQYKSCIENITCAIQCFENYKMFNKRWVHCYRLLIIASWCIGKNDVSDRYFQRLSVTSEKKSLLISFLPYYAVKGIMFYANDELNEALNTYMKAYKLAHHETEYQPDIVKNIIECNFYLHHYEKVTQWSDSCDMDLLDDSQKIMVAHSYYKIGKKDKAYQTIKIIKLNANREELFFSALALANFYFEIDDKTKAEAYYQLSVKQAFKQFGTISYNTGIAYGEIAYFYWYAKADYSKSLEYFHKSIYSLIPVKYCSDYYALPDISKTFSDKSLATALNNKAEALYEVSKSQKNLPLKLRNLQASITNWELSFIVSHRYKMSLSRDDQRYAYADLITHRYSYIIKACLDLYRITGQKQYGQKAFEYAEKSRASLLLSTVNSINAYKMHLLPVNLKKEEDQLWANTELQSNKLTWESKASKINLEHLDECQTKLYQLRKQQDSLIQIYKLHYPSYYNAKFNAEVIGADSLQKMLKPNEAILQYSLSADKMIIFMITQNEFKIFTDSVKHGFFTDIETYRKKLSQFSINDLADTAIRAYANVANRLYIRLVKPAEPYIKGKKLIIVPDDALTQIPFESLVTSKPDAAKKTSLRNMPYLIKQYVIDYSYSGTLFAMNHHQLTYHNARLLAVAPSYEKMKLSSLISHERAVQSDSSEISPIPGTIEEVNDIHRIFGGQTLLKKKATEERFKRIADNYDILHLATHGIINNEYPMFSKLVFKPEKDSVNDGLLNTYEIYNMQINSPLVVLSACNSGFGKLHKGEGIISLARGFFTAGAKSIVMTLWSVGDKTSSKLIHYFYSNLASKQNIGDAMRGAKLAYLEQTDEMKAHPYFWAGYIVLGNANSIFEPERQKNTHVYWYVLGILLLAAAIVVGNKKWRKLKLRH
jgi:CHAT domain-containing protein